MSVLRRVVFYAVTVAGVLLILLTLASLIDDVPYWYIKALDFPRVQVLLALLFCLLVFALVNRRWGRYSALYLIGLAAAIALQARFIFPYTGLAGKAVEGADPLAVEEGRSFSLLVANVWMENDQAEEFLEIVEASDPDLVLAMEVNEWWVDRLGPLEQRYPHHITYPLDNTYGMALYSRLPLTGKRIMFLSHDRVPSFHQEVRLPGGPSFNLHAVHPVPPKPSEYPDNVGEEEVALLKVGEMAAERRRPTLVAGDFNDVSWSKASRLFEAKGQLKDVRVGRGLYNSFDATSSIWRWPLDHVYVSEEFRVLELERLPRFGSDHFPILVRLALQGQ